MSSKILIAGAGAMAIAYARVLAGQGRDFVAVSRSPASAENFRQQTGRDAVHGGLAAFLQSAKEVPEHAIVAVNVDQLAVATEQLIEAGIRHILVEKPAGLSLDELQRVSTAAQRKSARVAVGYNRRFYASTLRAREMIAEDGGVSSLVFDFTERPNVGESSHPPAVKAEWLIANSSHVIDLAFFLAGSPVELQTQARGSLPWHPSGSSFTGFGTTETGAVFSYHSDWKAPGRWSVDIRTSQRRLLMAPMESLKVQRFENFDLREEQLEDTLDREYKPGLYRQVLAFLTDERGELLPSLDDQIVRMKRVYWPITARRE